MSVVGKCLIESKFASASGLSEYAAPATTHTIVDKFTATNTDVSAITISVNLVPSAGSPGDSNLIVKAKSIAAGATADLTDLQNQILNPSDFIFVLASTGSKLTIRASGREVT